MRKMILARGTHILFSVCLSIMSLPMTAWAQQGTPQRSIEKITDNVYRAQNNVHFMTFLVTAEGIILTDPINTDFSTWLKAQLDERFSVPVKYVLYSHYHEDHISGGAVFSDTAHFIGQENMLTNLAPPADRPLPPVADVFDDDGNGLIDGQEANANLTRSLDLFDADRDGVLSGADRPLPAGAFVSATDSNALLDEAQINEDLARSFDLFDADGDGVLNGAEIVRGMTREVHPPDITFSEKLTVSLGGYTAEMTWTGPITHSSDMSVIRFPDEGVVFVSDVINLQTMPSPRRTLGPSTKEDLLDQWVGSIRAVEAMQFNVVSPAHGPVGSKSDIARVRQYLEELGDAVAEGIRAGQDLAQMQQSIVMEDYADWFGYDWVPRNIEGMYNILSQRRPP